MENKVLIPNEHIPVLLNETVDGLNVKNNGIYVDCTLGRGGHSSEILKRLNNTGHLYSFDQDEEAIRKSYDRLKAISDNFTLIKSNFEFLEEKLK
jgi:16S rRNA (cytosine1402-N4)-methyltransferase